MSTSEPAMAERIHPAAWGCILYILVAVGRLPELVPGLAMVHPGKLAVLLALAGLVAGPPATGRSIWATPIGGLMAAFSLLAVASVAFSVWKSHSLDFLIGNYLSNIILFLVIARTATTVRMITLYLGALLGAAAILAIAALLAGGGGRIAVSTSYDPNDLAMVLVCLLSLAVVGVFVFRGLRRLGLLALAGVMLLVILMTGSRGGFLGLLAVAAYLFVARMPTAGGRLTPWFSTAKAGLLAIGVVLLAMTVPPATWERMATMTRVEQDYNLTEDDGRIAIWKRGLEAIGERPLGHGLAAFEAVEGEQGGRFKAAHNNWIQVGVELGVAGALLMAGLIGAAFTQLRRLRRLARTRLLTASSAPSSGVLLHAGVGVALKGALIGYLVTAFFLSAAYSTLLFALLAVVAATHVHAHRRDPAAEREAGVPVDGGSPQAGTEPVLKPVREPVGKAGPRAAPEKEEAQAPPASSGAARVGRGGRPPHTLSWARNRRRP